MIGWSIILVIFIPLCALFNKIKNKAICCSTQETVGEFGYIGCLLMIVSLIFVLPVFLLETKREVNQFKNYQELVEITYSEKEVELNYAMNIKIVEMNAWLNEARVKENIYGIFSFYYGKLDDLKYIEIGD